VGVKTDLDATREDLKWPAARWARSSRATMTKFDQLRRLGERDYVEFTIAGKNKPQKVATSPSN